MPNAVEPALDEELRRHSYRMTGSFADAERIVAETHDRASGAVAFPSGEGAPSAELFVLATRVACEAIGARDRRQILVDQLTMAEPTWFEPYPTGRSTVSRGDGTPVNVEGGAGLADPVGGRPSPQELSVSFVLGLQLLSPRQRAALLLHDVVGLDEGESAAAVELGVGAFKRLLDAARFTMASHRDDWPEPDDPTDHATRSAAFADHWAADDNRELAALLGAEVSFLMPSESLTIHGPRGVMAFLDEWTEGRCSNVRLIGVELNGQEAFALYRRTSGEVGAAFGFLHLDVATEGISRLVAFDRRLFEAIGLAPFVDW